ncbi:uncharacterized protein Z518_10974 [Rhinocladiella mackenziei CBS 650.93]|uniref:TIGR00297 family protein n=1 Tax=Rhinocladiella mackenziei CBS 650.93 TaxID=1442369 RepID=A0A0D2FD96_9EURO|nr:uncharacterized protein Z518_10974 [Rhinocladiella mackenziei CBS 650.93]KIX00047.1 hypothetical protein Z518_10974 [Rhinocladiella mackenziei CBS 650.93]
MRAIIAVPITLLLVIRAYTRQSLTPVGIAAAALTATIHALHPSAVPFALLCTFFLLGTTATKVKHDVKATLTLSSGGSPGGEGPRTSVQVFANSGCASSLVLSHIWLYGFNTAGEHTSECFGEGSDKTADLLLLGIMSNYAAVAADTLSSELGILSKSRPVLITSLRTVPPGTNGGVTFAGLLAGIAGSVAISATSLLLLKFCEGAKVEPLELFIFISTLGTLGTLLDSLLGAILQASVIDRRSGKIVEGPGGVKVLTKPRQSQPDSPTHQQKVRDRTHKGIESRVINSGHDILDNNQVNFLMASIMSVCGILAGNVVWR